MPVFGIDLGTTYSAIATLDDNGQPKLIQNLVEGSFILPSVVYFEDGATPCVGKEAKSNAEVYPDRVIQFVKRDIGKPNGRTINFDGKMEDPISISAYILKRLAEYSKEQDYDVKDVVITVPAYFGIEERNATRQAGEMAGFNVLGIVNEPTAAAINYCYGQQGNQKILVYDLGGGTFDVSIIEMITNDDGTIKIDIIDSDGNDRLGGMDWDKRLADFVLNEYAQQENISVDDIKPEMMHRIKTSAEGAKIALSTTINRNVTIPSNSEEGRMVKINVTREIFNDLTRDLVNRTMSYLNLLLQRNSMTPDDISTVLLVGGSTMMHIIMETVESMFKNSRVIRHDPNLAVAKGAALYAKINAEKAVEEILRERKKNPQPGPGPDPDNTNKTEPPIPPLSEDTMREIEQELQSGTSSVSNIEVSDILSCSVGVLINRRMGDGDYYNAIDNFLSYGDKSPAEEINKYIAPSDGGIYATFYQNKLKITEDDKIKITKKETRSDQHYIKLEKTDEDYKVLETLIPDPNFVVKEIGALEFVDSAIKRGDDVIVKIEFSTSGLWAYVTHVKTDRTEKCELKSETGKSAAEIEEGAARIAQKGTASGV